MASVALLWVGMSNFPTDVLWGEQAQPGQVADALLVLDVDVEIAHQHDGPIRADALLATRELAALHVALHDVDAILLVEGNA